MDPLAAPPEQSPSRWRGGLPWLVGSLLVALVVAMVGAFRLASPGERLELAVDGRVAVLPVANDTGELVQEWARWGLAEMVATTLAWTPGTRVVAPERLRELASGRRLDPDDDLARGRLEDLAWALGAELLVDLRLRRSSGRGEWEYALDLEVLDPSGTALARTRLAGSEPARLGEQASEMLAGALAPRAVPVAMARVYSSSPFLNRLYGMGLAALVSDGPEAARPYFRIVAEHESRFLAARLGLAECERRAGRLEAARALALGVLEEAQNRGERSWEIRSLHDLARIEALAGDTARAEELAAQVGALMASTGQRQRELAVLEDRARFALAQRDDPRADRLYRDVLRRQQEAADRLGQADTLAQLGALALRRGAVDEAGGRFAAARVLAQGFGDIWLEMRLLSSLGEVAYRQGAYAAALEHWRRAATFYEQRGERARLLFVQHKIAETTFVQGDHAAAEDAFQEVLELSREEGDVALEALASLRLSFILLRLGYPKVARPHLDRALELSEEIDEPLTLQRVIAWQAYEEGHFALAVATLETVKRQAEDAWRAVDEAFLGVFARALEAGRRLPVPGEGAL